jgi:hypothetical protein
MKTLTIFSAILLPLTFISSIYGMNGLDLQNFFDFSVGFAIVLTTMGAITVGLFIFFKKKQWILAGADPLDAGINTRSSSSKAGTRGSKESFDDDDRWNKKRQEHNNISEDYTNPSNRLADSSAEKMRGSEIE